MLFIQTLQTLNIPDSIGILLAIFLIYYTGWIVYARLFHPLHHIPGPFLASITYWWYFRTVRYGIAVNAQLPLHKKYGKVVRITPDEVSISDATAVETVYGTNPVWQKTEFYDSFNPKVGDRVEIFATRDEALHTERRRIVAPLFTPGAVLQYEPAVDRAVGAFSERLDSAVASGAVVEMSNLHRQYALDVVGEIYHGKEGGFGCLKNDSDYKSWLSMIDNLIPPISSLGCVPKGMQTIYFMSQMLSPKTRRGLKAYATVVEDSQEIVKQRRAEMAVHGTPTKNDMLSRMMNIVQKKGLKLDFTDGDVAVHVYDAIMAGSDTTAGNLTSQFYHVLRDRRVYAKLATEVRHAFATGKLSHPVRHADVTKLDYWSACVKETLRFAPGGGIGLPRYIPDGGATIAGHYLPGGFKVTMNWHAVHFDTDTFGEDAEVFRPERWIENDPKTIANMGRREFAFGLGPRICMGKNIAKVEMYKLLPAVLDKFDLEMVSEWKVSNHWFRKGSNVKVKVNRR